jgi:hypothetical protein
MRIELVALNGIRFDVIEVSKAVAEHDLLIFLDRAWKKKSATRFQEVKSAFVPLPGQGNYLNTVSALPLAVPPKSTL